MSESRADAMLSVTRTTSYPDRLGSYKILVDGEVVAKLRAKETKRIPIRPGVHKIVAKIDWARSNYVSIEVRKNDEIEMECGSDVKKPRIIFCVIWALFLSHRYLFLRIKRKDPARVV